MAIDATGAEELATAPDQPGLVRAIGPKLLLFLVVGDILGTGIYALTGVVAGRIGGALWLPFLLAFLVAFLTAFSYLELVGKYPRAAGAALYVNRAFRTSLLTFVVGFAVLSSGLTSAASAATAFSASYLQAFVAAPETLVAIAFVVVLAGINLRGVTESLVTNAVLTCIELSGLLIVIGIGLWAVLQGSGEPGRLVEVEAEGTTWVLAITSATSLAFFAMVGFEDSVNMAEECTDPVRIFPRAMLLGMTVAGIIYVLVAITSSLLLSTGELRQAGSGALLLVVEVGAPGFPPRVFALIGLLAVINSALINMMMASRLVYGMARERILWKRFGLVHRSRRTPWLAIAFTSLVALLLVSTVDLATLGGTTSLLLLAVFTVVNLAVLILRRDPAPHRHFRAPTAVSVLGAISCAYLASPLSGRPAAEYALAGMLLAIGLALWLLNRLVLGKTPADPRPAGD
jgi:amino acid transporter